MISISLPKLSTQKHEIIPFAYVLQVSSGVDRMNGVREENETLSTF